MSFEGESNSVAAGTEQGCDLSRAETLAEGILRIFRERQAGRCALLLDPVLRDARVDLDQQRLDYGAQVPLSIPVRLAPGQIDPSHWPVLVDVDPGTLWGRQMIVESAAMALQDWGRESLRKGKGHRIGGWLASNRPLPEMAAHLASRFVHRRPSGQRSLLRLHDPSVIRQAWQIFSPVQQSFLLGPSDCWIAVAPDGILTSYTAPDTVSESDVPAFDSEQWLRLDNIGPINRALPRLPGRPGQETVQLVADALIRARGYGFEDPEDLAEFAWRAFTVSPRFDLHAVVSQRIAARHSGDSFGYALADLTETQWNDIAMDFDAGKAP